MRTLIKGGTIVTAEQEYVGDILVEGDVIRAMGTHLDEAADLVIDAKGKYVFPGGVDQVGGLLNKFIDHVLAGNLKNSENGFNVRIPGLA